jgi:nitrite reductase (NADH) small subunit
MVAATLHLVASLDIRVCRLEELPLGIGRAFDIAGRSIAIFRTRGGRVHAVANMCPHRGGPLSEGMLAGDRVVCPFHGFRFGLADGRCEDVEACEVDAYPARVQEGWVVLTVPVAGGTPHEKTCSSGS